MNHKTIFRQTVKELIGRNDTAAKLFGQTVGYLAKRHRRKCKHFDAFSSLCIALQLIRHKKTSVKLTQSLIESVNTAFRNKQNRLVSLSENPILSSFMASQHALKLRNEVLQNPLPDAIRLREHRVNSPPHRQGNLMLLKRPCFESGEKGVLFLKFNESFFQFASVYDVRAAAKHYRFVLEPSNACAHLEFFFFVGNELDVVIQCPYYEDFELMKNLALNLYPVDFGASDWVDEQLFNTADVDHSNMEFEFDVAMIARWGPLKRHHALFTALNKLRPNTLKTVLVGYPHEWDTERMQRMIDRAGLSDSVSIRERLTPQGVADVLRKSKVSISVSLHEGAVRALTESLFCDTPVIVNKHNVGVNQSLIVKETGRFSTDEELHKTLCWVIENRNQFSPRNWALANTGANITSAKLNSVVKDMALAKGEPWTKDLAGKANRPNLDYLDEQERINLEDGYLELASLAGTFPDLQSTEVQTATH